jgi:hypothetical protein
MDVHGPLDVPDRPEVSWQAGEVVRDLNDRPHLLTRIQLRGRSFPQLNAQPFVRVLGRRQSVESWFAEVADDQSSLTGYFAVNAPLAGAVIEWGYGSRVWGRITSPFDERNIQRLNRERLPRNLVPVTEQLIRRTQAGKASPKLRMPPRRRRRGV